MENEHGIPKKYTEWQVPKTGDEQKDGQSDVTKVAADFLIKLSGDHELGKTLKEITVAEHNGKGPTTQGWRRAA